MCLTSNVRCDVKHASSFVTCHDLIRTCHNLHANVSYFSSNNKLILLHDATVAEMNEELMNDNDLIDILVSPNK